MKKKLIAIATITVVFSMSSCKQENIPKEENTTKQENTAGTVEENKTNTTTTSSGNKELWAEQVESSIALTVPDDWAPEDWNTIFKKVDRKAIYNDVIDAVLNGKQKAYNFFNDSAYTVDQVKSILNKPERQKNQDKIVENKTGPDNISVMRVREKVYFDKEKFKLGTIPTALILYINHYSEDGSFVGYKPLFYVKLNN
jgi:hypothetical protein